MDGESWPFPSPLTPNNNRIRAPDSSPWPAPKEYNIIAKWTYPDGNLSSSLQSSEGNTEIFIQFKY